MKELPILMCGEMVRATLRDVDPKTQTRRVVKFGKLSPLTVCCVRDGVRRFAWCDKVGEGSALDEPFFLEHCPYGEPGDRLWVRETWATCTCFACGRKEHPIVRYQATDASENAMQTKWRPSIHMPRWASRITLEIVSVRVERVQDITETDAIAEGIAREPCSAGHHARYGLWTGKKHACNDSARVVYMDLWETLNAERGYGWDVNPWVWVVSFKRVAPCL